MDSLENAPCGYVPMPRPRLVARCILLMLQVMARALINRLSHNGSISELDRQALLDLDVTPRSYSRGDLIVESGEPADRVFWIETGCAARYRVTADGGRQIVNLMLEGDVFDLQAVITTTADHTVSALNDVVVAEGSAKRFIDLVSERPGLANAFWWAAVQEESILREQIVRVGRRGAIQRLAHLFCEIYRREMLANGCGSLTIQAPLTRETLADLLGLSSVHVSRTLSRLKAGGLVSVAQGHIVISDLERLAELCEFNPRYLHLTETSASAALEQADAS